MHYGESTGHYYQPPVNHRALNFPDITLGRSDENAEPIMDSIFNPTVDKRFDGGGNLISMYFYKIEPHNNEAMTVTNDTLQTHCRLYRPSDDRHLPSIINGIKASPIDAESFNELCQFFGRKRLDEQQLPSGGELAMFFTQFKDDDFLTLTGFQNFVKRLQIPIKINDNADMFILRREFRDYFQKRVKARLSTPNGQHRLYPCALIAFGSYDVTNKLPIKYGNTTQLTDNATYREMVNLTKDSPIFRMTAINIATIETNHDIETATILLRQFGKTMQDASKKAIHYRLRDHVSTIIQSMLQSDTWKELNFENSLSDAISTKDLESTIGNNIEEMITLIHNDISANQATVLKDIFGAIKPKDWTKALDTMFNRIRSNKYNANFVTGTYGKYLQNKGVLRYYTWIGQFLKMVLHTRKSLEAADKFMSYAYPRYKQNSTEPLPLNFYTTPEWFGPMIVKTALHATELLFDILTREAIFKNIFPPAKTALHANIKRRLTLVFHNNIMRDILETIVYYGMDPQINSRGRFVTHNDTALLLEYLR